MQNLTVWCDRINEKATLCACALLFLMLIFSGVAIFWRYALSNPLVWAGDILLASFVWLSFLGISIAYRSGSHVLIDSFINLLPEKAKAALLLATRTIILVLTVLLTIQGVQVAIASQSTHSGALRWPPTYFYAAFPTAFFLISLYGLDDLIRQVRSFGTARGEKEVAA